MNCDSKIRVAVTGQITYPLRRYSPHSFAAITDLILKVKKEKRWDQDLGLVFNMKEEIYVLLYIIW